jgi:hypothetical protein
MDQSKRMSERDVGEISQGAAALHSTVSGMGQAKQTKYMASEMLLFGYGDVPAASDAVLSHQQLLFLMAFCWLARNT